MSNPAATSLKRQRSTPAASATKSKSKSSNSSTTNKRIAGPPSQAQDEAAGSAEKKVPTSVLLPGFITSSSQRQQQHQRKTGLAKTMYDMQRYGAADPQILEVFKCAICFHLISNASATKCAHVFCHECIHEALINKSTCPVCCTAATVRDLDNSVALLIQSAIDKLPVVCTLPADDEVDDYEHKVKDAFDLKNSLKTAELPSSSSSSSSSSVTEPPSTQTLQTPQTQQMPQSLIMITCDWKGRHEQLKNHQKECPAAVVECDLCKLQMYKVKFQQHAETECVLRPAQCTFCHLYVPLIFLDDHVNKVCRKRMVPCPFKCTTTAPGDGDVIMSQSSSSSSSSSSYSSSSSSSSSTAVGDHEEEARALLLQTTAPTTLLLQTTAPTTLLLQTTTAQKPAPICMVQRIKLAEHKKSCPMRPITCPLQDQCGAPAMRWHELNAHWQDVSLLPKHMSSLMSRMFCPQGTIAGVGAGAQGGPHPLTAKATAAVTTTTGKPASKAHSKTKASPKKPASRREVVHVDSDSDSSDSDSDSDSDNNSGDSGDEIKATEGLPRHPGLFVYTQAQWDMYGRGRGIMVGDVVMARNRSKEWRLAQVTKIIKVAGLPMLIDVHFMGYIRLLDETLTPYDIEPAFSTDRAPVASNTAASIMVGTEFDCMRHVMAVYNQPVDTFAKGGWTCCSQQRRDARSCVSDLAQTIPTTQTTVATTATTTTTATTSASFVTPSSSSSSALSSSASSLPTLSGQFEMPFRLFLLDNGCLL